MEEILPKQIVCKFLKALESDKIKQKNTMERMEINMKNYLKKIKQLKEKYDVTPIIFIFLSILVISAMISGAGVRLLIELGIPFFIVSAIAIVIDILSSR